MSRFQTPQIVQPGNHARLSLWLLLLLLVAGGALAWKMFDFGRYQAGFDAEARDTEIALLKDRVRSLQAERDSLQQKATRFERAAQIDREAVKATQEQLRVLQDERAKLQKEAAFLKSLVSGDLTMLQVTDFHLHKDPQGNRFTYKFTVSKRAKGNHKVRGHVALGVRGQNKGKAVTLSAKELGIKSKSLVMGFSFFQQFEGELRLPVGFIPKSLVISVRPNGKKFKSFDHSVDWQLD